MRKPIGMKLEFVGSCVALEMLQKGVLETSFTKEEFDTFRITDYELHLTGDFATEDDEIPQRVYFTLVKKQFPDALEASHELH